MFEGLISQDVCPRERMLDLNNPSHGAVYGRRRILHPISDRTLQRLQPSRIWGLEVVPMEPWGAAGSCCGPSTETSLSCSLTDT